MKNFLNEEHLGQLFGIVAFVYFLYAGLAKDQITSDNDLIKVEGTYLRQSSRTTQDLKTSHINTNLDKRIFKCIPDQG